MTETPVELLREIVEISKSLGDQGPTLQPLIDNAARVVAKADALSLFTDSLTSSTPQREQADGT